MRAITEWPGLAGRLRLATLLAAGIAANAATVEANAQPYVTGKLGYASAEFALGAPYSGVVDDGSLAYGVAAGTGLGRFLGVEAEVTGYGSFDGRATPCPVGEVCTQVVRPTEGNDLRTLTLSLMPQVMLGRVDLFGRVGYYRARIETDTRFGGSEFTENGVVLGAGVRWDFDNRPWDVSVEATRFDDNLYRFTVGFGWQAEIFSD